MADITYNQTTYLGGQGTEVLTIEATNKIVFKCDSLQVRSNRAEGPKIAEVTTADGQIKNSGDRDEGAYISIDQVSVVYS